MPYAMIIGSNGYSCSSPSNNGLDDAIEKYHSERKTISCVAVGPDYYFAVCCDTGASTYNGPSSFRSKMKAIDSSKIKHISFGPDDQWAITMKSGWCYYSLWTNKTNCQSTVIEHNGNIKYVSLCKHTNDWIVGWDNNGHKSGGGLCDELTGFLSGINSSRKSIYLVELGANDHYFIHHENGRKWSMNSDLSNWYKIKSESWSFSTISLW